MAKPFLFAAGLSITLLAQPVASTPAAPAKAIDEFVRPYVDTRNFSGVILVARAGVPVFQRAYGFADRDAKVPNRLDTRFHIASMSMQFTAVAALRLINAGKLSLDTTVSDVVPDYPNGRAITVRHLLTQTSGIADINGLSDYADVLQTHQTPASLVAKVEHLPPDRPPGTYHGEEHSAYNLLALIVERRAGVPFARAVDELVFRPLGMKDSGIDDDSPTPIRNASKGYQPEGLYDIAPAQRIHWSAKTGNASAFTTVADELKFVRGLQRDDFLKPKLRSLMFDPATPAAYGWFKSDSSRFGQQVLSMSGRSPGFTAAMINLPKEHLFVVALSNIYASVPPEMVEEIAALALDRPYQALSLKTAVDPDSLAGLPAAFQFPKKFYQPDAVVRVSTTDGAVSLHWPSGDISVLIPTSRDHYVDRGYWMPVEVVRDANGRISKLKYGTFVGEALLSGAS
jgi:CubicO group peptidase (beta-lactamase class C family)